MYGVSPQGHHQGQTHDNKNARFSYTIWNRYTVVSAYIPPGFKPTSASVLLKEFPNCFCYHLHSKVSLFSSTGCKHKPASVSPQTHNKSVCKPIAENQLFKLVYRMRRAAAGNILIVVIASLGDTRIVFGMHYII